RTMEPGSGTVVGGVTAIVPWKLAVPPRLRLIVSWPFNAKAPPRGKSTGAPTVAQAFAGGALAGLTQVGVVTKGGPVTTANVFPALPQPVKPCELPAAAFANVAAWLADSVSGLLAGSMKLFTAKLTIRAVVPALMLLTAVFVSV